MKWPQSMGVSVSDTNVEITTAKVRVSENSLKNAPTMPPIRFRGRKAASSDRLIEMTVKPICRAPTKAA